jgi:hypothetical protein
MNSKIINNIFGINTHMTHVNNEVVIEVESQ